MFIWSCAIYRLYKTYTHRHTLAFTPRYRQQASRNLHKCVSHDRSCLYIIKLYYAAEQDPSPQEQETKALS